MVVTKSGSTAVQTIDYALREARDLSAEFGGSVLIDIRIIAPDDSIEAGTKNRIEEVISAFDAPAELRTRIEYLTLRGDTSESQTEALLACLGTQSLSRLIIAADTELAIGRLRERFGVTTVELAPSTPSYERRRLLHPGGPRRFGTIFGLTYLFYLAIGGFAGGLDLLTGAVSAGVVALAFSHVALSEEPELQRTGGRLVRMVVFLPVLLWQIAKANLVIAYLILHPELPVDPSLEVIETDTRDGLERMVLANSITLTPGTLTIDVRERAFTIHSLTARARSDLSDGRFQRLVSWVFHGNEHTDTPNQRGGDS